MERENELKFMALSRGGAPIDKIGNDSGLVRGMRKRAQKKPFNES